MPAPVPDAVSAPFWDGLKEQLLLVQRCPSCSTFYFPPTVVCSTCLGRSLEFVEVPPVGTLYSRTVMHQAFLPSLQSAVPYVIALVEIDGAPGVRMMMNVAGPDADVAEVGASGRIVVEPRGEWMVPAFLADPAADR
jgi:uncharacterized OB-fold protein